MNANYRCQECGLMFEGALYLPETPKVRCPNEDKHDSRISQEKAVKMLNGSKGRFFTIEFVKRTTGELRRMTARLGVKKHLKGGARAYDPAELGLLIVWESRSATYKSIPTDAIKSLRFAGKQYEVVK